MALEIEIKRYSELLPELLRENDGKYVVIKGEELLGIYEDYSVAYSAGLERYGFVSFLLRQIRDKQPVIDMTNLHLGLIRVQA